MAAIKTYSVGTQTGFNLIVYHSYHLAEIAKYKKLIEAARKMCAKNHGDVTECSLHGAACNCGFDELKKALAKIDGSEETKE